MSQPSPSQPGRKIDHQPFSGVLPAVITPCDHQLEPDLARLASHCLWLLDQGCDGLLLFGTTGQGNSFTVAERRRVLEKLPGRGVPAERLMIGAGACAVADAVELSRASIAAGAAAVLLLPPYYYKQPTVDGLFAHFAEVIEKVGSDKLRVYLYHIPPVAHVGIPAALVERLVEAYPRTVVGIKDSSGDWENTRALLESFPGFGVFAGSERYLHETLRGGGAGCISAVANVLAGPICRVAELWRGGAPEAEVAAAQAATLFLRDTLDGLPILPALHAIHAYYRGDEGFVHLRPPFRPLDAGSLERLFTVLDRQGFSLADIATVTGRFRIVPLQPA